MSTLGEKMAAVADNPTPENFEAVRVAQREDYKAWARKNGVQVPPNVLYDMRGRGRNYHWTPSGWVERVLLVNRCGFEKSEVINADDTHWRVPLPVRMVALEDFDPKGSVTQEVLIFIRTPDRASDGRAIFREDGWA